MPKRRFRAARNALSAIAMVFGACFGAVGAEDSPPGYRLQGDIKSVHDPAIIKADGRYYVFSTSHIGEDPGLIHWRVSGDLLTWKLGGAVFENMPAWAVEQVPGTRGIWAPDISYVNGEYRLYYSVSTFGENTSAMGLAVTPTLDPEDESYGWTDKGLVYASDWRDDFNAIDPNLLVDAEGRHWLAFGSFWTGLKMIAIDPETGLAAEEKSKVHALARRSSPGAVEAPFIIEREGYYYLFASFGFCCRGENSTYSTVVGRSKDPTGPYKDRDGKKLMNGGGFLVLHADLDKTGRYVGPGHVAILKEGGEYFIVYHAYDTREDGVSTLRIQKLGWTETGWPVAL